MAGRNPRFGELFAVGRDAARGGAVSVQVPPADGGARWGISVVLRPEGEVVGLVDDVTAEAMGCAGDGHWPTGAAVSSHFTVRALERHRAPVAEDDERVGRYRAAMMRAAARAGAVRLWLSGLTLTPGGVMLCADPVDGAAASFSAALADELGEAGWFEADFDRDIWYATLVHFTSAPRDPGALVGWVDVRRHKDLGLSVHTRAHLVAWRFDGRQAVTRTLATARLGG